MRQYLFEMTDLLVLSAEEYAAYWPYVSNIWHMHAWVKAVPSKKTRITYWDCRLGRATSESSHM
jgi:hypothetical protein